MWPFKKKKKQGRVFRSYAGAASGRLLAEWVAGGTSADTEIRFSLTQLRNRSRQLGRDNDYVRNFFRALQNNVIGQGISFQAQVRKQRGRGGQGPALDDAINSQIEAAWERWKKRENCHTAGRLCFEEIERLIVRSVAENGEVLVRFISRAFGDMKTPIALEIIEADLLDENYTDRFGPTGNYVRMGVEYDEWKRPVAYHFLRNHPGDYPGGDGSYAGARIRIPAGEILHLFVTERVDQKRGVPWLYSTIIRLHHMQGYEEAEVIAARASAALMGFIESPEAEPSIKDDVEAGQSVTEFEPGVFKKLDPGEKVNVPAISRPGGQFDPFMRMMLRGVSAGLGASYESLSRDYSQTNYSSARQGMLEDRDNWRSLQAWIIYAFHQVVLERFMDAATLAGDLVLPGYDINPAIYTGVKWLPRGWSWVDPLKEVSAYKEAVRNGFMTQSDVVAQSGGDFEELVVQRRKELDLAEKNDLVFDTDPSQVNSAGANQLDPNSDSSAPTN